MPEHQHVFHHSTFFMQNKSNELKIYPLKYLFVYNANEYIIK